MWFMSNAGSDKQHEPSSIRAWLLLGGLLIFVIGGLGLAITLLPVLTGLLFPPAPPVPDGAALISHDQLAHGDGDWTYTLPSPSCDVVTFYAALGMCHRLVACDGQTPLVTTTTIAVCEGTQNFSIFAAQWQAIVRVDGSDARKSNVEISSRVLWMGQ